MNVNHSGLTAHVVITFQSEISLGFSWSMHGVPHEAPLPLAKCTVYVHLLDALGLGLVYSLHESINLGRADWAFNVKLLGEQEDDITCPDEH